MIIYKDVISGDEMFSDIYKVTMSDNMVLIKIEAKMENRTEKIKDSLIGGNASAEQQDEGCDDSAISGYDIVLNHKLQETYFTKQSFKVYIKDYMKAIRAHLQDKNPDREKPFVSGAEAEVKKIIGNFKKYRFFTGESMNPEGMVALLEFNEDEDDDKPTMNFFYDGLELEKC